MTDTPDPALAAPALSARGEAARQARLDRQAQALRANLRRRKDQARGRQEAGPAPDAPQPKPADTGPA